MICCDKSGTCTSAKLKFLVTFDIFDTVFTHISAFKYCVVIDISTEGTVVLYHANASFLSTERGAAYETTVDNFFSKNKGNVGF